jgi:hypothetical protein
MVLIPNFSGVFSQKVKREGDKKIDRHQPIMVVMIANGVVTLVIEFFIRFVAGDCKRLIKLFEVFVGIGYCL